MCTKSIIKHHINYHPSGYATSTHHSQYYSCKKTYFTVVLYLNIIMGSLFYIKQLFTNLISFHSQMIHMCIQTHSCQMTVTETSKQTNFWDCFFYNMINNLAISKTCLQWKVLLFIIDFMQTNVLVWICTVVAQLIIYCAGQYLIVDKLYYHCTWN